MLVVKTKLGLSKIEGIGLFANESIKKGQIVWMFNEKLDTTFTKKELESLSESAKEQIYKYSYFDKSMNKYILCGDDARFFNHSDEANCDDSYNINIDKTVANKDIEIGEEITCNYKSYYGNMEEHNEID